MISLHRCEEDGGKMKQIKTLIYVTAFLLLFTGTAMALPVSESTNELITEFADHVKTIRSMPTEIDYALCQEDDDQYDLLMTELADTIVAVEKETRELGVDLSNVDFWGVYNKISENPECGKVRNVKLNYNFTLSVDDAGTVSADFVDDYEIDKMTELDYYLDQIRTYPDQIDQLLCGGQHEEYENVMKDLAELTLKAEESIKSIRLYKDVDVWAVYNAIKAAPYCGIVREADDLWAKADTNRTLNEELMGIEANQDFCNCWDIASGRERPTGYWDYEVGICRCSDY